MNLDFEKESIEGVARPWGWDLMTYTATAITLDSAVKQHGAYSLQLNASSATGAQLLTFNLEPYELQKKTIAIDGWIKTRELQGTASFMLSYQAKKDTHVIEIRSEVVTNSREWTRLTIKAKLPDDISLIYLVVQHEGIGTAWFDNFSVAINGKKKEELEIAPSITDKQLKWLHTNSYPLARVDTLSTDAESNDELRMFKSLVDTARIIALGESTHGTSEFFRLKHRMLEYSVKELGVRIFAIEDHQLVVRRVNDYILGGSGTARSSMYGMLGVWQTEEVRNLIEWLRNYNNAHPEDKVEFVGFDMQNHSLPIDSLTAFIAKQSPNLSQSVHELLDDLRQNGMNSYAVSDSVKLAWFTNSKSVLDLVAKHSATWLSTAQNKQDSLAIYWGIQYVTLIKQFAENAYKGHASLYRDIAMAENVSWIMNVYKPGSKMLIWAHDAHISRGEHPDSTANIYFGKSMGAQLSKKYGAAYKSFGLFTYQGEYSCYVSYTNFTVTDCPLYLAPKGTLDEALHRVALHKKTPALLLDLRKAKSVQWLTQPLPVRFANHVNIEYGYWTRFSVPYQFDAIFFIDKTTSAKSYARN